MEIIKIHEEVLSYLLELRKAHENLFFVPRKINNGQRLEKGYWFLGNENYLHLSFWIGIDWKEKIHNIGFVIHSDGSAKIELSAQDDPISKAKFLEQITNQVKGFSKNDSKNKWYKHYKDKDYLKNLDNFIFQVKPQVDELIKKNKPKGISLIDNKFFNKYIGRIYKWRDNVDFGIYDDLFKNSKKKPFKTGTQKKHTDEILVSYSGRYLRRYTHNIIQQGIYDKLVSDFGKEKVQMEENSVDIIIKGKNSTELIEVKPYESVILCIREGLGQLMSYYFRDYTDNQNVSLTIIGYYEPNSEAKNFIKFIKTTLNIEFNYKSWEELKEVNSSYF